MHTYEIDLRWVADRKGIVQSPVLPQSLEVATPPEFPKGIAGLWSPEHLFVAAVNSCFMTTFLAVAENSKFEFSALSCKAVGTLDKVEGKYQITEVALSPVLTIRDEEKTDRAVRILEMSEKACLISNSIRSKIVFQPKVDVTRV